MPARVSVRNWERTYLRTAVAADAFAALVAAFLAYELRFPSPSMSESVLYPVLTLLAPLAWIAAMAAAGAYDRRFIGVGSEEFRRLAIGALGLTSLVGTVSWATNAQIARGYVVIALPSATVAALLFRYALRKGIHRLRRDGRCIQRTIVVGDSRAVEDLVEHLARAKYHGYEVVGACVPNATGAMPTQPGRVPVVGDLMTVGKAVEATQADTVAVSTSAEIDRQALRRLAWDIEPTGADLIVAPALVDVTGPRLTIRPVEGLPLLHVDRPAFRGARRMLKEGLERILAALALAALAPIFAGIAVAVKIDSRGPALFRQTRVGRNGEEFTIFKFRTMVSDAEAQLADIAHLNVGKGPLFKVHRDPRVTRVGDFLRRTSLDELPQLINIVLGHMSLVGPRPHLPAEVALFGDEMIRRLLVKPGLTGLWQISGRSDLTWDESVRLDLRYVENWNLMLDLAILWKTLFVVLRRAGAY